MAVADLEPIARFAVDSLQVQVYEDRAQAGRAAAQAVALSIRERQQSLGRRESCSPPLPVKMNFSQGWWPVGTSIGPGLWPFTWMNTWEWLPATRPRFGATSRSVSSAWLALEQAQLHLIPGERADRPLETCLEYENLLLAEPADIVCAASVKTATSRSTIHRWPIFSTRSWSRWSASTRLAAASNLHDGCFDDISEIPTHAYTLTVPALLKAPVVSVIVPGQRKANAVLATLRGPISEACPASALRRHAGSTLYLDRDAARLVL